MDCPVLTHHLDGRTMYRLTSSYAEPVEPDRAQPSSHNWTDMVLRGSLPSEYRSEEARVAGRLLKSQFSCRMPTLHTGCRTDQVRLLVPNLLTAMESLSWLGFPAQTRT